MVLFSPEFFICLLFNVYIPSYFSYLKYIYDSYLIKKYIILILKVENDIFLSKLMRMVIICF